MHNNLKPLHLQQQQRNTNQYLLSINGEKVFTFFKYFKVTPIDDCLSLCTYVHIVIEVVIIMEVNIPVSIDASIGFVAVPSSYVTCWAVVTCSFCPNNNVMKSKIISNNLSVDMINNRLRLNRIIKNCWRHKTHGREEIEKR